MGGDGKWEVRSSVVHSENPVNTGRSGRGAGGVPAVKSSRLLHVIYLGLKCGGNLHCCDVN